MGASVTFGDALSSAFRQYVGFSGRARRSEYWFFVLFVFLAYLAARMLDFILGTQALTVLVALGLFLPSLALTVRRLHDIGNTGWWVLVGLVPLVGGIVLLVLACTNGEPGPNRFGPSPKQPVTAAGWGAPYPPAGGYPQAPFGQAPYGQAPYGQAPYGQAPYGQAPYGQAPYGQGPYPPAGAYPQPPYPPAGAYPPPYPPTAEPEAPTTRA